MIHWSSPLKFNLVENLEVLGGIKDLNLQSGRTRAPRLLPLLRFLSDLGTIETKNPIQHPDVKMKHAIVVFSHFKTQPKIALRCHTRHIRIGKIDSKQPEWFTMIQGSWGDLDIIQSIQWGLKGRWADGCNKSQTSAGSPSPVELVPWLVHPGGVSWCLESALDFGVVLEGKWWANSL